MSAFGKVVSVIALATLIAGCKHISPATGVKSSFEFTQEEKRLRPEWAQAKRPDLAVAMSGGGLRSSLYNFGVLKALYDDGLLQQAELVSSVSGGSYLTYWIYSEQARGPDGAFGAAIFDEDSFAKRLCEFTGKANFVPLGGMVKNVPKPTEYYAERLRYTFGAADTPPVTFPELGRLMKTGRAPYLVMNATVFGRRYRSLPWTSRYFEMTPLHHGSLDERRNWSDGVERDSTLQFGALASGAAIPFLRRWFPRPDDPGVPDAGVFLWDGGNLENLGAVTTLRRGARRIVIIDAQFDNKGKNFDALQTLKVRMQELGVTVNVKPDVKQEGLGVYPGRALGTGADSRIAYVKMERPTELENFIESADEKAKLDRKRAFDVYDSSRRFNNGKWDCGSAKMDTVAVAKLMQFNLGAYIRWADGNTLYRKAISRDHPVVGPFTTHAFPRTTTTDQSFYVDQALAYVALGYLTAKGKVGPALSDGGVTRAVPDSP